MFQTFGSQYIKKFIVNIYWSEYGWPSDPVWGTGIRSHWSINSIPLTYVIWGMIFNGDKIAPLAIPGLGISPSIVYFYPLLFFIESAYLSGAWPWRSHGHYICIKTSLHLRSLAITIYLNRSALWQTLVFVHHIVDWALSNSAVASQLCILIILLCS